MSLSILQLAKVVFVVDFPYVFGNTIKTERLNDTSLESLNGQRKYLTFNIVEIHIQPKISPLR